MRFFLCSFVAAVLTSGCGSANQWTPVTTLAQIRVSRAPDGMSAMMLDEEILAFQIEHEEVPAFVLMRRRDDRGGLQYEVRVCAGDRCRFREGFIEDDERHRADFRLDSNGTLLFTPPVERVFCELIELARESRQE